jgi:transposase InsO family protein
MGRDKFEQLCYANGLKLVQKKNFRKTTDSTGVIRFPNLIKQIEVTGVNQVFVSDITYFEINGEFYYISLIMDLFNRELVGYSASDSLRTEQTTLPALQRLVYTRGSSNLQGAVIHSDGGGQYYCKDFLELTGKLKMLNSMTEESVFENSHAERLNGVIKNNYLYPYGPTDLTTLRKALKKAVKMYNTEKAHRALEGMTPVQYRIYSVEKENNSASNYPFSTEKNKYYNKKILSNLVNTI